MHTHTLNSQVTAAATVAAAHHVKMTNGLCGPSFIPARSAVTNTGPRRRIPLWINSRVDARSHRQASLNYSPARNGADGVKNFNISTGGGLFMRSRVLPRGPFCDSAASSSKVVTVPFEEVGWWHGGGGRGGKRGGTEGK